LPWYAGERASTSLHEIAHPISVAINGAVVCDFHPGETRDAWPLTEWDGAGVATHDVDTVSVECGSDCVEQVIWPRTWIQQLACVGERAERDHTDQRQQEPVKTETFDVHRRTPSPDSAVVLAGGSGE
jgi:hypothetical protein